MIWPRSIQEITKIAGGEAVIGTKLIPAGNVTNISNTVPCMHARQYISEAYVDMHISHHNACEIQNKDNNKISIL